MVENVFNVLFGSVSGLESIVVIWSIWIFYVML